MLQTQDRPEESSRFLSLLQFSYPHNPESCNADHVEWEVFGYRSANGIRRLLA